MRCLDSPLGLARQSPIDPWRTWTYKFSTIFGAVPFYAAPFDFWDGNSDDQPLLPVFARAKVTFERGEGVRVFIPPTASVSRFRRRRCGHRCGHAHPHLVEALTEQAQKIWHTSNLYQAPGQEKLAERLIAATFADTVFFTNSGAEALECAIKMARKYHAAHGHPERYPPHHLRGRLPWPHAGHHRRRRPGEISRRLRPQGRRLRPGAVWRSSTR